MQSNRKQTDKKGKSGKKDTRRNSIDSQLSLNSSLLEFEKIFPGTHRPQKHHKKNESNSPNKPPGTQKQVERLNSKGPRGGLLTDKKQPSPRNAKNNNTSYPTMADTFLSSGNNFNTGDDELDHEYSFDNLDLQENDAFQEPLFVKQRRQEFEMFLSGRPDLTSNSIFEDEEQKNKEAIELQKVHFTQSLSPTATLYKERRCGRYVRNFGKEAVNIFRQREQDSHHRHKIEVASGSQSFRSPKMSQIRNTIHSQGGSQQRISLIVPFFDKEKLKSELNQLIAYRVKKQLILEKLKADLHQVKLANEETNVFKNIKQSDIIDSDLEDEEEDGFTQSDNRHSLTNYGEKRRICCESVKSPVRDYIYNTQYGSVMQNGASDFKMRRTQAISYVNLEKLDLATKKTQKQLNWDPSVFSLNLAQDALSPKNKQSNKSQFELKTQDQLEQNKTLKLRSGVDEFSVIDLEFRRTELKRFIQIKMQQLDEEYFQKETLIHQIKFEKAQRSSNKKQLLESIPNYEEQQALEYKFQYIAKMGTFDKIVAQHMVKLRKEELRNTHIQRQGQILRAIKRLKYENDELHKYSGELEKKQLLLEHLNYEISEIRMKQQNLNDIKRQWARILRQKFREHRKSNTIKIIVLIQTIDNMKHESSKNVCDLSKVSKKNPFDLSELTPEEEAARNKIFIDLHHTNIVLLNKLQDFRAYCNSFFDSDKADIEAYFREDLEVRAGYLRNKDLYDPPHAVKIYNDSQFFITSLAGRHEFLTWKIDNRGGWMRDFYKVRDRMLEFSDEILDYLEVAELAKKNELDLTVDDLFGLRKIQGQKLGKEVIDLKTIIPVAKNMIASINKKIEYVAKVVKSIFEDEQLKNIFGMYVVGNIQSSGTGMPIMDPSTSLKSNTFNNDERSESQLKNQKSFRISRRVSLLQRPKVINECLQEVLGPSNAFLNIEFDDDITLMAKKEPQAKKKEEQPYPKIAAIPNRDGGQGIAREIFSDKQADGPAAQQSPVNKLKGNQAQKMTLQKKQNNQGVRDGNQVSLKEPNVGKKASLPLNVQISKRVSLSIKNNTLDRVSTESSIHDDDSQFKSFEKINSQVKLVNNTNEIKDQMKKIGMFIEQVCEACSMLNEDLSEELDGKPLKIDYAYYEKKFHEKRYIRQMQMRVSKLEGMRFTNSQTSFRMGTSLNSFNNQAALFNKASKLGGMQIPPELLEMAKTIAPGKNGQPDFKSIAQSLGLGALFSGEDNALNRDDSFDSLNNGKDSDRKHVDDTKKRKLAQKIFVGSDLMNGKFRKQRDLQMFEIRERAFLNDFKKKIQESYIYNH